VQALIGLTIALS
jgi:multifunctional beta-oxidation protein